MAPLSVARPAPAPAPPEGSLQALNRGSKANTMVMQAYRPVAKRPPWIAIVVSSMAVMLLGVAALFLLQSQPAPSVPTVNSSDQLAGTMGDAAAPAAASNNADRLRPLLDQIQSRVERQELFPPAADNALDLLKQARLLAPGDSSLRIVDESVRLNCIEAIRSAARNSRQAIARRWVDRALEAWPEDADLQRFRERLDQGLPI